MSTTRRQFLVALPLLALPMTWTGHASAQLAEARDYWPTDDWRTAPPAEFGIDPAVLAAVDARVPTETPDLSALLVVRHGYLVYERYYGDHEPAELINVRSVTKSVTGALIGIALAEGALRHTDQTIGELIPDRIPGDADPNVAAVTLRQLLTMTSGLAWDAGTDYPTLIAGDDWVDLTLSQPVVGVPGETYVYNSGGSHLLSVILAEATDRDPLAYANDKLFGPLGISPGAWARSPQGERIGGFGLELTARDMARFGHLFLNGGVWDGEQIVPDEWVAASTTWQASGDATGGWAAYGYQWWVTATDAGYPAYFALGYGGQHIFVVPDLDLVVVTGIARRVPPAELRTPRYLIEAIAAGTAPGV